MVAVGPLAETLTEPLRTRSRAQGKDRPSSGSFALAEGLLLGAPLNSVTALHYAEAVADIPNKRWVTYEMPMLEETVKSPGKRHRITIQTALDCFAIEGKPDAVETIANAYVKLGRHRVGVGFAQCYRSTRRTS
ncbi:hypothetical protein ECZU29_63310 [Escherichia coli]|nr:hypothetical protein ECZU29_63310 [Escherichia coli]